MAQLLDPTKFNIALLGLGGLLSGYALLSRFIKERLYLSAPILALCLGIICGPVLGVFAPHTWGNQELILEELARLAIAVQLISTAIRLKRAYVFERWRA